MILISAFSDKQTKLQYSNKFTIFLYQSCWSTLHIWTYAFKTTENYRYIQNII